MGLDLLLEVGLLAFDRQEAGGARRRGSDAGQPGTVGLAVPRSAM